MKDLYKIAAVLALAALCCFVFPALVQRAEADPQAVPDASRVTQLAAACVGDVPVQNAMVRQEYSFRRVPYTAATAVQNSAAFVPVADGNGYPLGSKTWAKAVWAANPPESIPGS